MDLGLRGKTALVTGASQGIGRAVAAALAAEGAHVVLAARRREALAQVSAALRGTGASVEHRAADVTNPADLDALFQVCANRSGGADIVVANAGGPPAGPTESFDAIEWRAAADLVLYPVVELARRFVPRMRERGWGRFVAISSVSVRQPIADLVLSNSLRAAVGGFLKTLAREVAADGVTVNAVLPGYTATERISELVEARARLAGTSEADARRALVAEVPAGRMALPEEIGAVVTFLCSLQAAYVTGVALPADGGLIRGH